MPWLVSIRMRHRKSFSYFGERTATRISVILSAEGLEFVFICPEICSRSACVIRLPAAIAEVAEVAVVINALREKPEDLSDIVGFPIPKSITKFAIVGKPAESVGQTPWSARVPLDPLFARRIKRLPQTKSRPGGRASAPRSFAAMPLCGAGHRFVWPANLTRRDG